MKYVTKALIIVALCGVMYHQEHATNGQPAMQEYYNDLAIVDEFVRNKATPDKINKIEENGQVLYIAPSGSKISAEDFNVIAQDIADFRYFRGLIDKNVETRGKEGKSLEALQDGTHLLWDTSAEGAIRLLPIDRYNQLNRFFDDLQAAAREEALKKELGQAGNQLVESFVRLGHAMSSEAQQDVLTPETNPSEDALVIEDFEQLDIKPDVRQSWYDWLRSLVVKQ